MSPVFRHGRLRLYLLKLLDESPRHGYEMIRLLQDRFMGVYAPSPGTIYPRLARLEEEGLVTHDEVDGRKVYRITERGREELRNRSGDLFELEEEITASVRDIAREVTEDVRETMRNLRRELSLAARDVQRGPAASGGPTPGRPPSGGPTPGGPPSGGPPSGGRAAAAAGPPGERDRLEAEWQRLQADQQRLDDQRERLEAEQERLAAERERLEADRERLAADEERHAAGGGAGQGGSTAEEGADWGGGGWDGSGWSGGWSPRDLEGLARHFTAELRSAAAHAHEAGEQAASELRTILDDTLDRIRADVFRADREERAGGTGGTAGTRPPDGTQPPEN